MAIKLTNVSKNFGKIKALDNVSLQFGEKKIYGLLGNNGAGKTTMLNIIADRFPANSGEITMDGRRLQDNDSALNQIYLLSEADFYPESMKVKDAFNWAAVFYPNFDIKYANKLAEEFKLNIKQKPINLSTGYKSIFKIIMALASNARFLLLDEPVLGLDANHRDMFYKLMLEQFAKGESTIVISTHLIGEVANIIEHCFIIKDGRIIKDAPCEELPHGMDLQEYFIGLMNEEVQ